MKMKFATPAAAAILAFLSSSEAGNVIASLTRDFPKGRLPPECFLNFVKIPDTERHLCLSSIGGTDNVTVFDDKTLANDQVITSTGSLSLNTTTSSAAVDVKKVLKLSGSDNAVAAISSDSDENIYIYNKLAGHQMFAPPTRSIRAAKSGGLLSLAELASGVVAAGTRKNGEIVLVNPGDGSSESKGVLSFCQAATSSIHLFAAQDGSLIASSGTRQASCGVDIYSKETIQNAMQSSGAKKPTIHIDVQGEVFGQVLFNSGPYKDHLALALNTQKGCQLQIGKPKQGRWNATKTIQFPSQCGSGRNIVSINDATLAMPLNGDINDKDSGLCFVKLSTSEQEKPRCIERIPAQSNSVNDFMLGHEHFFISTDNAIHVYPLYVKEGTTEIPTRLGFLDTGSVSAYDMFELTDPSTGETILGAGSQEGVVRLFSGGKFTRVGEPRAAAVLTHASDLDYATFLKDGSLLIPHESGESKVLLWTSQDLAKNQKKASREINLPDACGKSQSFNPRFPLSPVQLSTGFVFFACNEQSFLLDLYNQTGQVRSEPIMIDLLGPVSDLIEVEGQSLLAVVQYKEKNWMQRLDFNSTLNTYKSTHKTSLFAVDYAKGGPKLFQLESGSSCVALQNKHNQSVTLWEYSESGITKKGELKQASGSAPSNWVQLQNRELMALQKSTISHFKPSDMVCDMACCSGDVQNKDPPLDLSNLIPQGVKTVESLNEVGQNGDLAVGVVDNNFWRHVLSLSKDGALTKHLELDTKMHQIQAVEKSSASEDLWFAKAGTSSAVWSH